MLQKNDLSSGSRRKLFLAGMAVIWLIISCEEKKPEPYFSDGVLTGQANITDYEYNTSMTYAGTSVRLKGPYGTIGTLTDDNGYFIFDKLGNGTYELSISREKYGTVRSFGIRIFGTDTVGPMWENLYRSYREITPPQLISQLSEETAKIYIDGSVIAFRTDQPSCCLDYPIPAMVFYIGGDNEVNLNNFKYSVEASMQYFNQTMIYYFDYTSDIKFNFSSGDKYYVKGYIRNPEASYEGYWDPYQNKTVYPTMNTKTGTNTATFTIP